MLNNSNHVLAVPWLIYAIPKQVESKHFCCHALHITAGHFNAIQKHFFSNPFRCQSGHRYSVAVSSRCLPLPFRGSSSRLCGMQFLRISMLFPAEQFPCQTAHFQSVSMPICSSAMQGVAWPFQRLYVGNQQIRLAICSTVKSRKLP